MGHNAVRIVGLAGLSGFDFIQVLLDGEFKTAALG